MKKVKFYLVVIIITCIIASCNNNAKIDKLVKVISKTNKKIDISLRAISPVFLDKINEFMVYVDSKQPSVDIIIVIGYDDQESSYIMMTTSYFYDTQHLLGYVIINNRLVAFCCPQPIFSSNLFDISMMKTNKIIEGFRNEKKTEVLRTLFDPINHVYLVHNKDSLELISKGEY